MEELARGFHVRVGGAPVGGQLARNRLLQDGLLELGEEGLLVGDFALGQRELRAALVDLLDEVVLVRERREIDLIVQEEVLVHALAVGVAATGLDAGFQEDG